MRPSVIILLAASTGLAAGFAVRWLQHGPADAAPSAATQTAPAAHAAKDAAGAAKPKHGRTLTPLAAHLEQQLTVTSGVSRWLEWMHTLEQAKPADFPDLARLAKGNGVALRMVSARWIELDRRHLFNTVLAETAKSESAESPQTFPAIELGLQLFEDWSKTDPAAAIAALSRPDLPGQMKDLRYTVLNSVMKNDPENGLKMLFEWRMENYGVDDVNAIPKWAAANPRHAAEFALSHPAGYTTQATMDVIGKAWAKTDPAAAMTFAAGRKDRYGAALATGVMREWAQADLGKAAAWLAAADDSVRNRLSGQMVEVWAKSDTAGAMNWIQENLTGGGMDEAIGAVLKGAAETSLPDAAALVAGMDTSPGRAKAAMSVAKKWWPSYDSSKPVPPEAITWLSSLDPASIKLVVEQTQWQWTSNDPRGFADFLTSPAGEHAPEYGFSSAARAMAHKNPQEAMEWAAKLPAVQRDAAGLVAFMEWQSAQPANAMTWLRQLPASDPRRESLHFGMIGQYINDRAAAAAMAKTMATASPASVREAVQALSIPQANKDKLLERLQLR